MVYCCLNCLAEFHETQVPVQICTHCNMRGMIRPKEGGPLKSGAIETGGPNSRMCTNCGELVGRNESQCPHCKFASKVENHRPTIKKSAHQADRAQFAMPSSTGKRLLNL